MYQIIYKYLPNNSLKKAYICARSEAVAAAYLRSQYLVDTLKIESVTMMAEGSVLYCDGRF